MAKIHKVYVQNLDRDFIEVFKFLVDNEKKTGKKWSSGKDAGGYFIVVDGTDDSMRAFMKFS